MQSKMRYVFLVLIGLCTLGLLIYKKQRSPFFGKLFDSLLERGFPCHPDPHFVRSDWFDDYAQQVYSVQGPAKCVDCTRLSSKMDAKCARWWHPTPNKFGSYKPRKWTAVLRPKDQIITPCEFGHAMKNKTACSTAQQQLFDALYELRVVYFPRSGTELGIVRDSHLLSADGDLDIFVDMPQTLLQSKLQKMLKPPTHLDGKGIMAEVHWLVPGCSEVHMVYNDMVSLELAHLAEPGDLCECRLDSVHLLCHRDGVKRMYTQYGPSWRVPLGVKCLDMPHWAKIHPESGMVVTMAEKLKNMINKTTDRIEAESVNELMDKQIQEKEMPLILAQLNVIANSLNLLGGKY